MGFDMRIQELFTFLHNAQEFARLLQFREALYFRQKFARMHASSAPPQFDRVLQMQHLVEENVFDGVARHARMVEDAADHNSVVRWIVVAETAAGMVPAPGELRAAHEPVEEAAVEVVE